MSIDLARQYLSSPEGKRQIVLGELVGEPDYPNVMAGLGEIGAFVAEPGEIDYPTAPPSVRQQRLVVVTGHREVGTISKDPRFTNTQGTQLTRLENTNFGNEDHKFTETYPHDSRDCGIALNLDKDTDHGPVVELMKRGYMGTDFRGGILDELKSTTTAEVSALKARLEAGESADVLRAINTIAREVTRHSLGVSDEEMPTANEIDIFNRTVFSETEDIPHEERAGALIGFAAQMMTPLQELISQYRMDADSRAEGQGLVPELARMATEEGGFVSLFSERRVTDENRDRLELFGPVGVMVLHTIASYDTSRLSAAHGIHRLANESDVIDRLTSARDANEKDYTAKINAVTTEILRMFPGITAMGRHSNIGAGNSFRMTDEVTIGHNDRPWLLYPAANFDPRVFDNPTQFDESRAANTKHTTFGARDSLHGCIGRHQATTFVSELTRSITDHGMWQSLKGLKIEHQSSSKMPMVTGLSVPSNRHR